MERAGLSIKDKDCGACESKVIGGKAANLAVLQQMGFKVPKWIVVPADYLSALLPEQVKNNPSTIPGFIDELVLDAQLIAEVSSYFAVGSFYAVRSSATDEDGTDHSYAGQFESCLFVHDGTLVKSIKTVWKSAFNERLLQYRKHNRIEGLSGIAIIIQEMMPATASGVAFSANPVSSAANEQIISAVPGLGEGLVNGDLNADNFIGRAGNVVSEISEKTHQYVFDEERLGGTVKVKIPDNQTTKPALSESQYTAVFAALGQCKARYGKDQDIEFAFVNDAFYLLQCRPITTKVYATETDGNYMLWDNSNIIESYPGVTTPLTFSFISQSYEGAYKLFCRYLGVSKAVISNNERMFANTLGLINGRVYYNLKTWYHLLAMLPGYSINARFMEQMMGVKERFDIPEHYRLSKTKAWWRMVKMAVQMYGRYLQLPVKRRKFVALLNATIATYKAMPFEKKSAPELMGLYLEFEKKLLNEWKAPLLNDFFAMIWFGMLQKKCARLGISDNPNIHNDLLCGSADIISTQPIHRSMAMATTIRKSPELLELFTLEQPKDIWTQLLERDREAFRAIRKEIERYLHDFGERCVGELKLETISYTQQPDLFVAVLKSYVTAGIVEQQNPGKIEETLRNKAEEELQAKLRFRPLQQWRLKRTLKKARELVSARENLRYERTRAFGIVRSIFSHLGARLQGSGILNSDRDVFYLTKEEVFTFIEGRSVSQDLRMLVSVRKQEFEHYHKLETPSERFATYGAVYSNNNFFDNSRTEQPEGDLKGIGCCPGLVKAKVRVVLHPSEVVSLDGAILVTTSTDPGWVTLFPTAAGILVERGSLLSHSAIVSREMGIPCIVSITGLLKSLKTGDEVEMDGSRGTIKIIKQDE